MTLDPCGPQAHYTENRISLKVAKMSKPVEFNSIFDAITKDASEAADLRFRADMMLALRGYFEDRGWNQRQIMSQLEIKQSRASELMNGKIHLVSTDKLLGYLAKLGFHLMPQFRPATRTKAASISCRIEPKAAC